MTAAVVCFALAVLVFGPVAVVFGWHTAVLAVRGWWAAWCGRVDTTEEQT